MMVTHVAIIFGSLLDLAQYLFVPSTGFFTLESFLSLNTRW